MQLLYHSGRQKGMYVWQGAASSAARSGWPQPVGFGSTRPPCHKRSGLPSSSGSRVISEYRLPHSFANSVLTNRRWSASGCRWLSIISLQQPVPLRRVERVQLALTAAPVSIEFSQYSSCERNTYSLDSIASYDSVQACDGQSCANRQGSPE